MRHVRSFSLRVSASVLSAWLASVAAAQSFSVAVQTPPPERPLASEPLETVALVSQVPRLAFEADVGLIDPLAERPASALRPVVFGTQDLAPTLPFSEDLGEGIEVVSPLALAISDILTGEAPWPEAIPAERRDELATLYAERMAEPLWYRRGAWDEGLDAALFQVENAHLDGLTSQDYVIEEAFDFLSARSLAGIAAADLLISAVLLPYVDHMANGRHARRPRFEAKEMLEQGAENQDLRAFMAALIPAKVEYQRLRAKLAELRADRKETKPIPLFSDGSYLRLGSEGPRVAELRDILTLTGDYDPSPEVTDAFDPMLFDEALNTAVVAFQSRKGLSADGIVGQGTRRALNARDTPPVALIKVNMERLRWEAPLEDDQIYVRVNIPQYRLHVRDHGEIKLDMRAIVGRNDRQTPILLDRIVNLKFSPDWTVPATIYREDILPRLRSNPGYAASAGYSVIVGGNRISAGNVDWSNPPRVTIYKNPSANGPLGGVRFSLTNTIGIFLHDTNRKGLFDRGRRNLSSGCVRVGDPAALAHYLVQSDGVSRGEVERRMGRGQISWHKVEGGDGVRVYLSYMTVFVDEDGTLQTTGDPYGKDRRLLAHFDDS